MGSSDIINNLLVATMSSAIKSSYGWLGLFLIVSCFGFIALGATYFYPYSPEPGPRPTTIQCEHPWLAKIGLTEPVITNDAGSTNYGYKEEEFSMEDTTRRRTSNL